MRFEIVTIFPGFFAGIFENGILRRALAEGLVTVGVHDLRAFTHDRHRTVDDRPFGGGEGIVLKPEPLAESLASLGVAPKAERHASNVAQAASAPPQVVLLSAQGRPFTQALARELASTERVVLVCGRYEGVDERINQLYCDMELSIGDYVLSGGELAAAVVVDATMRLLPGVLATRPQATLRALAWQMPRSPQPKMAFRAHSTGPAACSTTRTTPVRRSLAACAFPKRCLMETTPRFAAGAASSSCARPWPTAPIC